MTTDRAATADSARTAFGWGLLCVLSANMLIDALEVSVAVVALPSIGSDLGLSRTALGWVVSGFALGFGGSLLLAGRVVELLGRRRVYLAALLVFAVASLLGGLATSGPLLIGGRFVKGVCAALTAPTGLAIIAAAYPAGSARDKAVSVYSLFGAGGFSAGLLLSGLLTEVSWRWTFLFPAPVALVLFLFGLRLVPGRAPGEPATAPARPAGRPKAATHTPADALSAGAGVSDRYDLPGAVTSIGALAALAWTLTRGPEAGWADPLTLTGLLLAAALGAAFAHVERAAPRPLTRTRLFTDRLLVRSASGAAALNGSYLGFLFVVTLDLQEARGWPPLRTGAALLPAALPLAVAVAAGFSARLAGRYGTTRLIATGTWAPPAGYLWYLLAGDHPSYPSATLPALLLVGLGFVLQFAALNTQAMSAVPDADRGAAGGIYQTSVQLAGALVTALVAALLGAGADDARHTALVLVTVVGAAGTAVALMGLLPPRRSRPTAVPAHRDG
ncbi:MFS transporter [Streptomyces griseiscabiei]|uniref:MFS transporter n=1 Tax=Streptomyces griseiscabiei TaxID=2993540 RepID=A0ABU4L6T5_9ACTN|nr:MFS transporter [Streptomyces griseiscabiei]MBZ3906400.1 MFS transporter [Streptomyces griseiscabiei]MDX2911398.1 MFS transporter [Streptomyces griseiscabiei]